MHAEAAMLQIDSDFGTAHYYAATATPVSRVVGLLEWVEHCRDNQVMPTPDTYRDVLAVPHPIPRDYFRLEYPADSPAPGPLEYRYEISSTAWNNGWVGNLTIWQREQTCYAGTGWSILHQVNISDDNMTELHQLAADAMYQRATQAEQFRPWEFTDEAVREWRRRGDRYASQAADNPYPYAMSAGAR